MRPGAQIANAWFLLLRLLFILCAYAAFMTKFRKQLCRISFGYMSLEVHGKKATNGVIFWHRGPLSPFKKKKISISSRFPATFDPSDPRGKIAMENSAI